MMESAVEEAAVEVSDQVAVVHLEATTAPNWCRRNLEREGAAAAANLGEDDDNPLYRGNQEGVWNGARGGGASARPNGWGRGRSA
ncbi:MAG: hypothetical protein HYU41_24525 [Candidatus Rokubacteria bacterium]|nr:hypothetical protein [Candidatus Rokubacteria bacterium]